MSYSDTPDENMLLAVFEKVANGIPQGEEVVNTHSVPGMLADYLTPMMWGGERAGRSQQLAESSGQETPFNVRHPMTSSLLAALAGGAAGALGGGAIGQVAGGDNYGRVGTAIGALGGAAGGHLLATSDRRNKMRNINKNFDETEEITPTAPEFNPVATLFAPGRSSHRAGQAKAYRQLTTGEETGPSNAYYGGQVGTNLLANLILPGSGTVTGAIGGIGRNMSAAADVEAVKKMNRPDRSKVAFSEQAEKAANDVIQNALTNGGLGAAIGAGVGGLGGYAMGNKKRRISDTLTGALTGGVLGAGAGAGYSLLQGQGQPPTDPIKTSIEEPAATPPATGASLSGGDQSAGKVPDVVMDGLTHLGKGMQSMNLKVPKLSPESEAAASTAIDRLNAFLGKPPF